MFHFLTPVRRVDAGPLANADAVDKFWQMLPRKDPVAAQGAVSEALLDFAAGKGLGREPLRALLLLDKRALALTEGLLINYVAPNPQLRSLEKRFWRSAVELSQSFALAHEYCLRQIRDEASPRSWREYTPLVLLRLFQHRQIDFLLRPLLAARPASTGWTELHAAYRFAAEHGILHQRLTTTRNRFEPSADSTLEREYIHLLLLELMNDGNFSPYDAFWLSRCIPHWCAELSLQADGDAAARDDDHFVLDLDSAEGLKRAPAATIGPVLRLDPAPMLAMIDAEIESLRDPANPVTVPSSFGRARQMKLLRKVAGNYTPRPKRVDRRGERNRVTSTVKAIVGLSNIMRMLRHEEKKKLAARAAPVPEVEEITITVDGGYTQSPAGGPDNADGSRDPPSAHEFGVPHHVWQLKDRSASGCRLHAPCADALRVPPGTLLAIRDTENMRWSLAVVRRLKTRIGDRVDIGAEYVGQNPRGVTMAVDAGSPVPSGEAADGKGEPFSALYLRESARQPVMPFKTLIMGTGRSAGNQCLTLRSASAEYTVRLKEPIEEQDDFVWLPYEVLGRRATDGAPEEQSAIGNVPSRLPLRPAPLVIDSGIPTDWLAPAPARRASGAA